MSDSRKKNLVLYGSNTGNTEKIAYEIKKGFDRHGWFTDLKKLPEDYDIYSPDFDFDDYDFICVGSPVIWRLPVQQVVMVMRTRERLSKKIIPGPQKAIVFCTYAGIHLGPKEAEATLKLLEIEVEHIGFKVVGSLAIPGRYGNKPTPTWYHGDMRTRPDNDDLQRVKVFVDQLLG